MVKTPDMIPDGESLGLLNSFQKKIFEPQQRNLSILWLINDFIHFSRFVTQIKDQTDLVEMQQTNFECQLAPVGDPNMKVEWFLNNKPLAHSKYTSFKF